MGSTVIGVLSINETEVILTIIGRVSECEFDFIALAVGYIIKTTALFAHLVNEQILQAIATEKAISIENKGQTAIQKRIITHAPVDKL